MNLNVTYFQFTHIQAVRHRLDDMEMPSSTAECCDIVTFFNVELSNISCGDRAKHLDLVHIYGNLINQLGLSKLLRNDNQAKHLK